MSDRRLALMSSSGLGVLTRRMRFIRYLGNEISAHASLEATCA
jgi:hypothetical protein